MKAESMLQMICDEINSDGFKKDLLQLISDEVYNLCESGEENPLKFTAISKALDEVSKTIRKASDPFAIEEAEQYGKGEEISVKGVNFVKSQSVQYQYNGSIFENLKEQSEALKGLTKEAQTISKSTKLPIDFVNDLTGEVFTVEPAIKLSKDILKASVK